jgi:hypothetical protein
VARPRTPCDRRLGNAAAATNDSRRPVPPSRCRPVPTVNGVRYGQNAVATTYDDGGTARECVGCKQDLDDSDGCCCGQCHTWDEAPPFRWLAQQHAG